MTVPLMKMHTNCVDCHSVKPSAMRGNYFIFNLHFNASSSLTCARWNICRRATSFSSSSFFRLKSFCFRCAAFQYQSMTITTSDIFFFIFTSSILCIRLTNSTRTAMASHRHGASQRLNPSRRTSPQSLSVSGRETTHRLRPPPTDRPPHVHEERCPVGDHQSVRRERPRRLILRPNGHGNIGLH